MPVLAGTLSFRLPDPVPTIGDVIAPKLDAD
jgi:hypothetical protein